MCKSIYCHVIVLFVVGCFASVVHSQEKPDWIEVSADKMHFVQKTTGESVLFWGANYDHDAEMRLLDDYWLDKWDTVVEDFDEMKALGLNVVRIHLQVGRLLDSPTEPNARALEQLGKLIRVAEERDIYLYVTGLACYKKQTFPNGTTPWTKKAAGAPKRRSGKMSQRPVRRVPPFSATT